MRKKTEHARVHKEITYDELTLDDALELLGSVRGKDVLRGIGTELLDPKRPGWTVSVSLLEDGPVAFQGRPSD